MGIRQVVVVVACAVSGVAAADGWLVDTTAGFVAYDNVGKSRNPVDYRSATALELDVAGRIQPAWQTPGVVSFELWAGLDRFDRLSGLDQFRAGVGVVYSDRIGIGPDVPWWSVSANAGRLEYDDAKRDSTQWQLAAGIGRSFGDDVDLALRVVRTTRNGEVAVFDTTTTRASADLDWRAGARWGVFTSVGFLRGELSSAISDPTAGTGPTVVDDSVYGAGWRSYRVDSDVASFAAGATFALGETTQLVAAWERLDGRARAFPADYDGDLIKAQVTHAF